MERLCKHCIDYMIKYKAIENSQKNIMMYGLDLLFTSNLNIIIILSVGFFVGRITETSLLMLFYIPLQSFGGGYHCSTHLRCLALMVVKFFFALVYLIRLQSEIIWTLSILMLGVFYFFAPVEHKNAPFGDIFRAKMHKLTMRTYFVTIIIAYILEKLNYKSASKTILLAVLLSGSSILAAVIKKHSCALRFRTFCFSKLKNIIQRE